MAVMRLIVIALAALSIADAVDNQDSADTTSQSNPIHKVIKMLQSMQEKVTKEGQKEEQLYQKFECYCRNGAGELSKSISEAETKVPILESEISEGEAKNGQLQEDLKSHRSARAAAESAMEAGTALREKEAATYAKEKAQYDSNINALGSAITVSSKGMSGAFLQTNAVQVLKKLAVDLPDADRQDIMAFLSGGQDAGYVPQSGEIVGVLKSVKDNLVKASTDAAASEAAAIASHDELVAAKTKEVDTMNKAVETKEIRSGQLAVSIVQKKNDLSNTEEALSEDKRFFSDLENNCATQAKEWEERQKTRSEELLALADCIKVLNDGDALDLFRKALPSAAASFVQMAASNDNARKHALLVISDAKQNSSHRTEFDFISLAIQGKGVGLEKVVKMIDGMINTLTKEQQDEENKKEYCSIQIESSNDKKNSLAKTLSGLEASIQEANDAISTLNSDMKALEDGIKALDKSVKDATEQRKAEHKDFTEMMASTSAAKELLHFAINRLQKFYQPELAEGAKKPELVQQAPVLAQVSAHVQQRATPPATFGAYSKNGDGILALIGRLVADLDKDMTQAKAEEDYAQKDYEEMLTDSTDKRALDSKSLTEKNVAKAGMEADVQASKKAKSATASELMATDKYLANLHGECDFLLQYWDVRSQARKGEIEALKNAQSILNGVDVSLLQLSHGNLRRR